MEYLVLGANGYIGSYLYDRMKQDRVNVVGTGHRNHSVNDLIHFNILHDSIVDVVKLVEDEEKAAVICIAQTNIDQCRAEYQLARDINVVQTKKIIEVLAKENFHIIFFSTDNVFDGKRGNYTEQDKTNALNCYGKMKEELENFVTVHYSDACIFRLPKVLGSKRDSHNMLTDLENKAFDGEVKCIKDSMMSIVSLEDVYQACIIATKRKLSGIYNLSSGEIYSRRELATLFFDHMGIKNKEIVEQNLEQFNFKEIRPLNIGLNNLKFRVETGYEFENYQNILNQYFDNICQ